MKKASASSIPQNAGGAVIFVSSKNSMVQAKNGYRSKTILTAFFTNFGLFHERMQPWDCGSNSSPQKKSKCLFVHCISFLLGDKNGHRGVSRYLPKSFHVFISRTFKRFSLPWRNASVFILTARWQWRWIRAPSVAWKTLRWDAVGEGGGKIQTAGHGEF